MDVDRALADQIRAVYDAAAAAFDHERSRTLAERAWLEAFRDLLPEGPREVLDLGCGAGDPVARWFVEAGCAVTGVDFSAPMLELARQRLPTQTWLQADMRGLDLGRRFAGIVAWDSFFHLTADDQRAMFPVFARHLAPGGVLLFTSGPDAGEAVGAVGGRPVYHASLSAAGYAAALEAVGLVVRRFTAEEPVSRRSVWLARARRP